METKNPPIPSDEVGGTVPQLVIGRVPPQTETLPLSQSHIHEDKSESSEACDVVKAEKIKHFLDIKIPVDNIPHDTEREMPEVFESEVSDKLLDINLIHGLTNDHNPAVHDAEANLNVDLASDAVQDYAKTPESRQFEDENVVPRAVESVSEVNLEGSIVETQQPFGIDSFQTIPENEAKSPATNIEKTHKNEVPDGVAIATLSNDMEELSQWASQPAETVIEEFDPFSPSLASGTAPPAVQDPQATAATYQTKIPKPPESPASPPRPQPKPDTSVHLVKWITFKGNRVPILTQNENGPCPMIAITNVLLLRRKLTLPESQEVISGERIIAVLSEELLLSTPSEFLDEGQQINYEGNLSDALGVFPSLQTGLDINVRFTGVADFEYTPALTVFDLFRIPLYHGWVIDPQDRTIAEALKSQTYNQVVEAIVDGKSSMDPEKIRVGLLLEEFLKSTASQLTVPGLCELSEHLREGQLAILFRNNHFNTIYKKEGRVFSLVTDAGFASEPKFVWETLNDVDGDSQFVDDSFRLCTTTSSFNQTPLASSATKQQQQQQPVAQQTTPATDCTPSAPLAGTESSPHQIDMDRRLAVSIARAEDAQTRSDRELAERLQAEETRAARARSAPGTHSSPPPQQQQQQQSRQTPLHRGANAAYRPRTAHPPDASGQPEDSRWSKKCDIL